MSVLEKQELVAVSACDQCGGKRTEPALSAPPWTLVRCSECGFVFTSPRLSDQALGKLYEEEYYEHASAYSAQQVQQPLDDHHQLAAAARRLLRRRKKPLSSMDVGCGGGRVVAAFADAGFDASGVEPSRGVVAAARAAGRNVSATDVNDLPDAVYDCVTLMHVLEHVVSPSAFCQQLFRILKPGGLCIVEVPNFGSRAAQQQGADWYPLHPATHLSHFTPGSLANCLRQAGFQLSRLQRLGGAGVFAHVSEAVVKKDSDNPQVKEQRVQPLSRQVLAAIWNARRTVIAIPGMRRFGRWVNWELLGNGEYVRAWGFKPTE